MRIKRVLGMTRQYELHDGRIVSIEDFKAGRVPENRPQPKPAVAEKEPITGFPSTKKEKRNRW